MAVSRGKYTGKYSSLLLGGRVKQENLPIYLAFLSGEVVVVMSSLYVWEEKTGSREDLKGQLFTADNAGALSLLLEGTTNQLQIQGGPTTSLHRCSGSTENKLRNWFPMNRF